MKTRTYFSVNVSGRRSGAGVSGADSAPGRTEAGNEMTPDRSPGFVHDGTRPPLSATTERLSLSAPREFLRISEPRRELLVESGAKYAIDDFRRDAFVCAEGVDGVVGCEEYVVGAAIMEYLFGCRKLGGGIGEEETSVVGVEAIEFVTRWRGRGVCVVMVVQLTVDRVATASHRLPK
jgi:hypothetical protein